LSEIRIIGPDGQRFVFPSGTDPEVMKSAMRRRYTGETRRTTEMIYNTQLPDERMQGARDYLARDQLRQDMEAGRQSRRTEEATGPENVAKERFYSGAQGRTLGAAPLIQGAINIPISAMMYPFLTQEQKAGRSFDEFVSDMSSAGYDQARGSIDRAREKRPLESAGLEIAGGFIAGKTAYDDLGNRFLASQPGARGALVGAGSGAQYEFLESEGDPLAAGRGALIGAPVGAGVSKAMEAAAEPLGRLFRGEVPMPKLGPDATGAAYGAGLGGIAPADSAEERAQNMAVGAGIGLAPGVINRVRGAAAPRAMPDTMPAGAGDNPYFGRQSMRPLGSGPSPREIETRQQWSTATPIVTQARTTAQTAQQAADAALQSKAPADIARAKDQKKTLVGQLQEAQASRAGMDTPEDARLAETLASLSENTSDPVLLSTQISAAKTSLDRLLTDIGSPVEGNLIPVKTNILTRTQAPRSAAEGPQDRASVTRYAEGEAPPVKGMGFGAGTPSKGSSLEPNVLDITKRLNAKFAERVKSAITPEALAAAKNQNVADARKRGFFQIAPAEKLAAKDGTMWAVDDYYFDPLARGNPMFNFGYVLRSGDETVKVPAYVLDNGGAGYGFKLMRGPGGEMPTLPKPERIPGKPPSADDPGQKEWQRLFDEAEADAQTPASRPLPPIKSMGFGAGTPKTPQQAVRFETPGSPEWEAAKAKGLDMSQAGRMGRAKEMGYDTETVLYHGTTEDFDAFIASENGAYGPGIYFGTTPKIASSYASPNSYRQSEMPDNAKVIPVYLKKGQYASLSKIDDLAAEIRKNNSAIDEDASYVEAVKKLQEEGFIGVRDRQKGYISIFDPSNIRSVNAAFDPEKSGSSTLLAAAPFAAVGGVGAGTAMGEDD